MHTARTATIALRSAVAARGFAAARLRGATAHVPGDGHVREATVLPGHG